MPQHSILRSVETDSADESYRTPPHNLDAEQAVLGAIMLEHFHGAACRVGVSDTAYPHRGVGYNLLVLGQWMDPGETTACTQWTRQSYDAMKPFMSKARYSNYLGDDEKDVMAEAYGPNYARLQKIKAKYDPDNVFHLNQNILPAG